MTPQKRLETLLAGGTCDRVPRALWRHYPHEEFQPEAFVGATLEFHRRHDFDLVKIGPRSSFGIRDYGARDDYAGDYLGRPRYLNEIIREPGDWRRLQPLDPRAGFLGQTGACARAIAAAVERGRPVVLTVFSPATQAKNLAGAARLAEHWRNHPAELRAGLEVLTATTVAFLRSLADVPLAGIFYAIQECGLADLAPDYEAMCGEFDREVLTAGNYWLNILHLHGGVVGFERYARYPVSVLHWDEAAAGISLAEGRRQFPGLVSGGVAWPADGWTDETAAKRAALDAMERSGPERLLLGAGCVIPYRTPPAMIDAFCGFER